jgi:hypothetical protein
MSDWTSEYLTLIEDCEERENRLTDWERTFIDSLRKQIEQGRRPTEKQSAILDRCWENATARG